MNQEVRSSPGLNMEHGFLKKIEHNQHMRQQQVKDDAARKQETAKLARRVGFQNKSLKPSMELYRPPSVRMTEDFNTFGLKHYRLMTSNGSNFVDDCQPINMLPSNLEAMQKSSSNHRVHFQIPQNAKPVDLKSMLQRSKSFGGTDMMESATSGFDRENFPHEYQGIIKRALHDPNSLPSRQLMEVVRVLCSKAVESVQNAQSAAQICFSIIEKEKGNTFLESLLNSCREWYNERDKLLRSSLSVSGSNNIGLSSGSVAPVSRRWTAYVSFLMELFLHLKSHHHRHMVSVASNETTGASSSSPTPVAADQTLTLSMLLYECCQIILKPPSVNNVAEIECLRSLLTIIGKQLEIDSFQRMQQIVALMRDAFIDPSISAQVRKTLLELVELHANEWRLDLPQSMYYFPYTSLDRK
uniref:MIF4G domain-containing protein n=1 Tax=Hadrurus spadix TaxID=141984 RepID=A0A1W7RA70_9SCOR